MSARTPREPIIERVYERDDLACRRALELLLTEKAAGSDGGKDDAMEDHDRTDRTSIQK